MRYKILTIAGIVLLFGYFIMDSFKNSSSIEDPNRVVMVGGDTLGRDWGAQADEREKAKKAQAEGSVSDDAPSNAAVAESNPAGNKSTNQYSSDNLTQGQDPFQKQKLNSDDYSTVLDGNGREVITGYTPEQNDDQNFETRHQREAGAGRSEPTIKTRE